jgi:hypothetical protein
MFSILLENEDLTKEVLLRKNGETTVFLFRLTKPKKYVIFNRKRLQRK